MLCYLTVDLNLFYTYNLIFPPLLKPITTLNSFPQYLNPVSSSNKRQYGITFEMINLTIMPR